MSYTHRLVPPRLRGTFELVLGLLMIPLSLVPIGLYLTKTPEGYLMYLRGRYALAAPATPGLDRADRAYAAAAFRRLPVDGVPVLVYHGIGRTWETGPDRPFVVSRAHFAAQMRTLQDAGFHAIDSADLVRFIRTGDRSLLPRRPVLITFDDGRTDAMLEATPILRATHLSASMFVTGADASSASIYYANWSELNRYADDGIWQLENQTYDLHRMVDDVKGVAPISELVRLQPHEQLAHYRARIAADIDRNARAIAAHGGGVSTAFSYPFGDWGQHARAPGVVEALRQVLRPRVQIAFDEDHQSGWRFAMPGDDLLHVHRLEMRDWTATEFIARLQAAARLSQTTYRERGLDVQIPRSTLVAAAVTASCAPSSSEPVSSVATHAKVVAFSFNGGLSPYTPQILDVLAANRAHGTFFVLGQTVPERSPVLERMLASGDEIANGMWTGRHPAALTQAEIELELKRTNAEVQSVVPFRPCLTRPPYNEDRARITRIARRLDMTTALWSIDPHDQSLTDPAVIARRVLRKITPGAIVLLHDGGSRRWATVQALPRILAALQQRGYRVVTVSELLTRSWSTSQAAGR
ncbi:MAG TPA: polysaccharide deacetylase family protein [Gaiellaceae bacterium]|nr:polysaccharide deacetylase family protein [Gaiellaceae bacterium]